MAFQAQAWEDDAHRADRDSFSGFQAAAGEREMGIASPRRRHRTVILPVFVPGQEMTRRRACASILTDLLVPNETGLAADWSESTVVLASFAKMLRRLPVLLRTSFSDENAQ